MKEESTINDTIQKSFRTIAESLFLVDGDKSGQKKLSVFGGIVLIFACVALVGGMPYRACSNLKLKGKKS